MSSSHVPASAKALAMTAELTDGARVAPAKHRAIESPGPGLMTLLVDWGDAALAAERGAVSWVNPALCSLLGYSSPAQLIGLTLRRLVLTRGDEGLVLARADGQAVAVEIAAGQLDDVDPPQLAVLRPVRSKCSPTTERDLLLRVVEQLRRSRPQDFQDALETLAIHYGVDVALIGSASPLEGTYFTEHVWCRTSEVSRGDRQPLEQTFAALTVARARPVAIHDLAHAAHSELSSRASWGQRSYLGVPLLTDGAVYGTLELHAREPKAWVPPDETLLELVATCFTQAIEHLRSTTELRAAREHLEELVRTDGLTRLPNRRSILETAHREVLRARRYNTPMCVVLVDLDHFKQINESAGHSVGDALLRKVASALQGALREVDFVGRYGGDAFLLVLPNTTALQAVVPVHRLLHILGKLDAARPLSASIGIVAVDPSERLDVTLERAETALTDAKNSGRNQYCIWEDCTVVP